MPKLAANISMMFAEHAFLDRIGAAADVGFRAIECQYPYATPAEAFASAVSRHGLEAVLINVPPGEGDFDRGFAAIPGAEREFVTSLERALAYARTIGCKRIHVLAGRAAATPGNEALYVLNLQRAAERAAADGVTLLIEPLNAIDQPGYFLRTTGQAAALLDRIARANVMLQFDYYHCQISEGALTEHAGRLLPRTGHIQIAGVPGRHEPDSGEFNCAYVLDHLDRIGYAHWVGAEYRPAGSTVGGLGWARAWGITMGKG
ncbi:MAG TPA: TIM barrel protein [Stellaceae bacterium]|nr:TIM barrel protein [Stellaceae bacterium]